MAAIIAKCWKSTMLFLGLAMMTWPAVAASATGQNVLTILCYHDIRDQVADSGDADLYAVNTERLVSFFDWLRESEFNVVSLDQVVAASEGERALPENPVLLTFDDGLKSVYTKLFPLLQAYDYPAVVAVVTSWVENSDTEVEYGAEIYTEDDFMTWDQIREISDSDLVEIASHSHDMHRGVLANPQGNTMAVAVTREYSMGDGQYEDDDVYRQRVREDLARSAELIEAHTGKAPRAVVWPYGEYNRITNELAEDVGMPVTFGLQGASQPFHEGMPLAGLERYLISDNPSLSDLAGKMRLPVPPTKRIVQVDLDYVYDKDPKQQRRNVDALISRMYRLQPDYIFLQAFADPDGNDAADAVYFPNRHMPMRANLFSRVAWQLYTRADVEVFSWMPVLAWQLPDPQQREALSLPSPEPGEVFRLDPTNVEARRIIAEIYEDLTASSWVYGLHFHDDAQLRETELPALHPGDPLARSQYLIDFTQELKHAAGRNRSKLKTSRNLYPMPVLKPESRNWFAQDLDQFLAAYDYITLMAMPWLEGSNTPKQWLESLVDAVRHHPGAMDKTIFQLQTVDWRTNSRTPGDELPDLMSFLESLGVRHLGYYPDDFILDRPPLPEVRPVISRDNFPYLKE
ncbi:poly-beta-1,6-N-acetyl-D-glucosamine N-deacetylase PgaB [Halomonas sp. I1]|uniref:poly-beta-1,6-N-acetyl-D-glucosamine N-deacetylase PgaB n=1 Tax=Halomonas sp. I1 TaxID=393536 RepID=UPI0028DD4448|nr:poly-beta-1,6-N-acetyl-D-glucosamine N-deacetylase PgaB [Halomonas sp. I1]MDT8894747.1 poly-beta-1,6-N-acetyl-D-glucosamine N-deacetylase PgaB [Halomonas sp. I1]